MVLFKDFSSSGKKYLVVTKESNDAKEVDISMLVERPIIGRFAGRWPDLKTQETLLSGPMISLRILIPPLERGLCIALFTRTLQSLVI